MSFEKATRRNVPLLAGIAGPSGSGKTYSALRLATGLAGGGPIAAIDTERGRMLHYADRFDFLHDELDAPFAPERYGAKIEEALRLNPAVIVVDSFSHEWAGEGGVLDMQQAEFERLGGRDAVKVASWIKPKDAHKRLINHVLLRLPCHLIVCLRAEDKIEIVDDPSKPGKKKIVAKETLAGHKGWIPVTGKELPYELTISLVVTPDKPGVPQPIKLIEDHRALVALDTPLDEATGERLAAWAKGSGAGAPETLTDDQRDQLDELVRGRSVPALAEQLAKDRGLELDAIVADGWPALREQLTYAEAESWIERLSARQPAGAAA